MTAAERSLPVHLRIPGWCTGASLTVNGQAVEVSAPSTYTRIQRDWAVGDLIELVLPMPVRILRGHRLAEEITNQVAVQRGPVVYALESADLPAGVVLEQAALRRGAAPIPVEAEIAGTRVLALETEIAVLPAVAEDGLYADLADEAIGSARVRLIPYFAWGNRGPGEMSVWLPLVW